MPLFSKSIAEKWKIIAGTSAFLRLRLDLVCIRKVLDSSIISENTFENAAQNFEVDEDAAKEQSLTFRAGCGIMVTSIILP